MLLRHRKVFEHIITAGLLIAGGGLFAAESVDFKRDVQAVLEQRCYECHGTQKQKSGLRLDRKSTALKGGDSGKAVFIAGKSSESLLIQKISSNDPDEMMPPKGERLTPKQVASLKAWIDQGAVWPDDASGLEKKHWAYEKPVRHPLPKVKNKSWPRNAIDYFVLARLDKEGLKPSSEAERAVWLRRVSLDLIGLPPTLEEVDAFLADKSKDAFETVVDRLLASPHYGERWARPWLDLARYADTQGYEKDNRRNVWPYRDWVIKALNANLPFDEFTIEQIAGDMLPNATQDQKVATGFHRNTMTNTEGGTDNEEFRYEAVVDRVNTTMSVWMGTTFTCCQCHNHKYDPFTTKEYYQVMAFLNSTADADSDDEAPTMQVFLPGQSEKLASLRATVKTAEKSYNDAIATPAIAQVQTEWEQKAVRALTDWQVLDPRDYASAGGATLTKTASKSVQAAGRNSTNDTYTVTTSVAAGRITGFRLEVLEAGDNKFVGRHAGGFFVLKQFEASTAGQPVSWRSATADYSQKDYSVTNLLAGLGKGWATDAGDLKMRVRRSAYFALASPLELSEPTDFTFTLRHTDTHPFANVARFRLYATSAEQVGPATPLPDDVRAILVKATDQRDDKQRARLKEHFQSIAPELKAARETLASARNAEKDFNDALPISSVMVELAKARETHRHIRGGYLSLGELVTPGTPAVLHPFPTNQLPNRLGFARWLVDTNNPLTARVVMNRIWEQYFGKGIVETVEEFGKQGEPPSHPELFDWLATEFMRLNWDLKAMHKLIALSATYRQASRVTPELYQRDPYNRLLARGPRVRLEAEMIRDQALAVSGLLSHKVGGPSVMPPQPDGLWQVVYSGDAWKTSPGEDKYRRGLYTFWRRTTPHPMMVSFDAPSREFCVLRRSRSDTPLQALNTLNDPAFIEAAQALARRVSARPETDLKLRAAYAFRLCLARVPQAGEVERLAALYEKELANYRQDAKAADKMANSELGKAPDGMDNAELAAWTVVANVLLNLDEAITKG